MGEVSSHFPNLNCSLAESFGIEGSATGYVAFNGHMVELVNNVAQIVRQSGRSLVCIRFGFCIGYPVFGCRKSSKHWSRVQQVDNSSRRNRILGSCSFQLMHRCGCSV